MTIRCPVGIPDVETGISMGHPLNKVIGGLIEMAKIMRKNNEGVVAMFINGEYDPDGLICESNTGNLMTDGRTIWSYGIHYPIATKIPGGF